MRKLWSLVDLHNQRVFNKDRHTSELDLRELEEYSHIVYSLILFQVISVTSNAAQVIINLQLIVDPLRKEQNRPFFISYTFQN